ncbi:MAG: O-methyltransferase [Phycisphaerales bacterium JB038]
MSSETWTMEEALRSYLIERSPREDAFLKDLKDAALAADIPGIWISPEQAALMRIILHLSGARRVVEVGTLCGYGAINMARGLPDDGLVKTIEVNPKHADFAEEWIARSDVAGKIEVRLGLAAEVLGGMAPESADAIFIDADKESYPLYLEEARRLLRPGGIVMADNAFMGGRVLEESGDADVLGMQQCNDALGHAPDFEAVIVPIGDGMWLGVKE